MKIIDGKGMLFGKINIIDFLVVLFLLCLTPMFYFGIDVAKKSVIPKQKIYMSRQMIEIPCMIVRLQPEIAELIKVGDKEVEKNGEIIGEIISVRQIEPLKYIFDIKEGKVFIKEDKKLKEVSVVLRLVVDTEEERIYYKNERLVLGSLFIFNTNKYTVEVIPFRKE